MLRFAKTAGKAFVPKFVALMVGEVFGVEHIIYRLSELSKMLMNLDSYIEFHLVR